MPEPGPTEDVLLSVIVPLAPDETDAEGLLQQLFELPTGSEVIVVKPSDSPAMRPAAWPDRLAFREYTNAGGRARQMNLGARVARGRWLWFLHADSRLLRATLPALQCFTERHDDGLGWFNLRFRRDGPRLTALNAIGANLRARWLGMPFGDQGLVVPRVRFESLGGFDESVACGEDHLLVWAARHAGLSLHPLHAPLQTSARKYARHGWLATTLNHWRLTVTQAWPQWRRKHRTRT